MNTEQGIQFRKRRELGTIFSDSFLFLKQEIKPISKLVAVYVLPFIILYAIVQVYLQKNILGKIDLSDTENLMANIGPVYMNILIFSLFGLFVQALLIATFYTYIDLYVKKGKGNFDVSEVSNLLFSNGLLAIGLSLVIFVIVVFGIILCILPGIYFAVTLSPAFFILLFERQGIGNAITRSAFLVNRQWLATFAINIIGLIIIWIVSLIISFPSMIAGFTFTVVGQAQTPLEYPTWFWLLSGFSTVVSSVLYVIPYTFLAMQYFNLDELTKPELPSNKI